MDQRRLRATRLVHTTAVSMMLFFVTLLGFAQATSSGTIVGAVTDASGALIPGAQITVTDVSTRAQRKTVSNRDGQFLINDVLPGIYNVTAALTGFSTQRIDTLTVSVGTQSTANFKLAVGAENTTISVEASTVDLQTINASTGQTVDPNVVAALPAVNRDVSTFTTLQPGVTPGGNVAGTTSDQATYQLDGGSNSSDMDGTSSSYTTQLAGSTTGAGATGSFNSTYGTPTSGVIPMPQDSVEEFKVTTTGQTADFNNSSGGQVQVVTKRGHEHWHGTAYEYYLDSNLGGNTWENNFLNAYTPKPSYHYSRYGASAGGPILPTHLGGKTYFFANYEGFRFPQATTYERTVPSYEFAVLHEVYQPNYTAAASNGGYVSATQLQAADPRGQGYNTDVMAFYNKYLPVPQSPSADNGASPVPGGTFDQSCGALNTSYCDGHNFIGYKANVRLPVNSDFMVARVDHDFGQKWHVMASYRFYDLRNLSSAQIDIGGALPGDKFGVPTAVTPRPQKPWFLVFGVTTNINSSLTNDLHYSYLRNYWQWFGPGAPPQFAGAAGAIEPLGENSDTTQLTPYNVNATGIRTRVWDGQDQFVTDNVSKLKGDHFIQVGGSYQHNYNYHLRTDNGTSINNTPTYLLGDSGGGGKFAFTGTTTPPTGLAGVIGTSSTLPRVLDAYFGMISDSQVVNTYLPSSNGTLTLQPAGTPAGARSTVPYYNLYATDTWHMFPSFTLNYGLSWALEMPPTEQSGNQVMFTDASGKAIYMSDYLAARSSAALAGQIYNPTIGFARLPYVNGGTRHYLYDPFYKAFSPRLSFALNPKPSGRFMTKLLGDGATVFRGGYGRIYGRINGDIQLLNPLLSPGLLLGTQCQQVRASDGICSSSALTDATVFRFGPNHDGVSPTLASASLPLTLPNVYRPGIDGPGVAIASPDDPSLRPDSVDTINASIQRQLNRKMVIEVGYIGRIIHNEEVLQNPNSVPYMLTLGGQSFASAYRAVEAAFGCTTSIGACQKSAVPTSSVTSQPFFEAALSGSSYCTGYSSCTAAVVTKQATAFRQQEVFTLWQNLDTAAATGGAGWNFPRSLEGTPLGGAYGAAGQLVSGPSVATSAGWGNYNGGYVTFKTSGFRGLTAVSNLTFSKALGLGSINQSTNGGSTAADSFDLSHEYSRQPFDQRIIFNTMLVYDTPWYKSQAGFVGRLAGGWEISPLLVAGSGVPLRCTNQTGSQVFGGVDSVNLSDRSSCVFNTSYRGGYHTNRGVTGGMDPYLINVGTSTKGTGSAAVNMFSNPVAVWNTVRPTILGLDQRGGLSGAVSGLGYLNLDLSVNKTLKVWEKTGLVFYGQFYNVMNHLDFANPSLTLATPSSFGVTKSQGNSPRQIQIGVRANF